MKVKVRLRIRAVFTIGQNLTKLDISAQHARIKRLLTDIRFG